MKQIIPYLILLTLGVMANEVVHQRLSLKVQPIEDLVISSDDTQFMLASKPSTSPLKQTQQLPLYIAINELTQTKKVTIKLKDPLPEYSQMEVVPLCGPGTMGPKIILSTEPQVLMHSIDSTCNEIAMIQFTFAALVKAGVMKPKAYVIEYDLVDQ